VTRVGEVGSEYQHGVKADDAGSPDLFRLPVAVKDEPVPREELERLGRVQLPTTPDAREPSRALGRHVATHDTRHTTHDMTRKAGRGRGRKYVGHLNAVFESGVLGRVVVHAERERITSDLD